MVYSPILLLLFFLPIILTIILKLKQSKLPPGPKPWPIIGHLHLLGDKPHRTTANLSKTHGPMMSLKLGSVTTIVISSSKLAKEMFLNHDLPLSSRHVPIGAKVANHGKLSIGWLPVCPEWRTLRKISTLHLFTNKQLNADQGIRQEKVTELIDYVRKCCKQVRVIDVGQAVFSSFINVLSNALFSIDLTSYDDIDGCLKPQGFKAYLLEYIKQGGRPNLADAFPLLESLDLQGLARKVEACFFKVIGIFEEIIGQRLRDATAIKGDGLDKFLQLVQDNELSLDLVKHLLFDLFIAGTDTTSAAVEWAMTELLRHPEKMAKAQAEMDRVIGKNGLVQERDMPKLSYIQAVVKETLRLHPPTPLLLPHKAEKDVQLSGYLVPKNAQIWVNVWWISRDPNVWSNPDLFMPERFLDTKIDAKSRDFDFIPFGEGRRMCPGMTLAYKIMHLILANLLHSFNWKTSDGVKPNDICVEEKFGIITLRRVKPLQVVPLSR